MNGRSELEAALRRVLRRPSRGGDALPRSACWRCSKPLPPQKRALRMVAGGADGLEFRARLAARRGARRRRRARHLDRTVERRHAASRPISIWCGSRAPTMRAPTCSMWILTGLRP